MRNLLARTIVVFASVLTLLLLGHTRRADARVQAGGTLIQDNPVQVNLPMGRLLFPAALGLRNSVVANFQTSEIDTLAWVEALPDGAVYWDVGANIGVFALYASLKPGVLVLAFEPAAASYAALNRNIEVNAADQVRAYCIAFAQESKLDTLNMAITSPGSAMHGFGTEEDQFGRTIDVAFRQGALGLSIDDFVEMFSPPLPTHVKVDVDGIEAAILRGGRRTLSADSVQSMIVEIEGDLHSTHNREILDLMAALGFTARPKVSPDLRNIVFDRLT